MKVITKADLIKALEDVPDNAKICIGFNYSNYYSETVAYDEYANSVSLTSRIISNTVPNNEKLDENKYKMHLAWQQVLLDVKNQ